VGDNVDLIFADLKSGLMDSLAVFPEESLVFELGRWSRQTPFVRTAFTWTSGEGFGLVEGDETENGGLISGMKSESGWLWENNDQADTSKRVEPAVFEEAQGYASDNYGRAKESRQKIREQTSSIFNSVQLQDVSEEWVAQMSGPRQGWAVIGDDRDPRLVGWYMPHAGARVRGIEVSVAELLDNIEDAFPARLREGERFVLRSRKGVSVYSIGRSKDDGDSDIRPLTRVAVDFPGWTLEYYRNPDLGLGRGFVILASIMVFILAFSILAGGTLLLLQARRASLEAVRKTNFVSNVSHELKTPLTTIRMYAELLGEDRIKDEEKKKKYLEIIIGETQRLTRLVNNVLDFSRLEQGRKRYRTDRIDVTSVVRKVLEILEMRLVEAGVSVDCRFEDREVICSIDGDAFEQAFSNLVDNAIKYASEGGAIAVRIEDRPEEAVVEVADQGPGIPLAHRERVFDDFHRVDDSLTAGTPGLGLGLSIARRIIRDCGGEIRYVSIKGAGACFQIVIPKMDVSEGQDSPGSQEV
jgi:signal transduction histidine kinase